MLATPFASSGPPRPRLRQRGSGILLYGADGARGAHILKYLLKGSSTRRPRVHCLGAWATAENGAARIERAMREAGLWKPQYAARIVPVANAQVTQAGFRLPADAYERLVAQVGAVVHAGTPLLWSLDGPLVAENVSALMNLVAFARRNGADVHYVSSPWLDGCALACVVACMYVLLFFAI